MLRFRPCIITSLNALFATDFNLAAQRGVSCGRHRFQPSETPVACQTLCTVSTQCICVFRMTVITNSDAVLQSISRLVPVLTNAMLSVRYDTKSSILFTAGSGFKAVPWLKRSVAGLSPRGQRF